MKKKIPGRQEECVSERTKPKEEEQVAACVEQEAPTCDKDCRAACNTDRMNTCLEKFGSTSEFTIVICMVERMFSSHVRSSYKLLLPCTARLVHLDFGNFLKASDSTGPGSSDFEIAFCMWPQCVKIMP